MANLATHNHTQSSTATTWTITHNLGTKDVAVDVVILNGGNLEKVIPLSIVTTDSNTVTVTFSAAQEGRARVVGGGV